MQLPLERDQLIDLAFLLEAEARMTAGAAEQQRTMATRGRLLDYASGESRQDRLHALATIQDAADVTASVAVRLGQASRILHAILNCPEALNALRKANP